VIGRQNPAPAGGRLVTIDVGGMNMAWKCPECGGIDLMVTAETTYTIDANSGEPLSDIVDAADWEYDSRMQCSSCDYSAQAKCFEVYPERPATSVAVTLHMDILPGRDLASMASEVIELVRTSKYGDCLTGSSFERGAS